MSEFQPHKIKEPFSREFVSVLHKIKEPLFTQKDTPFSPRMLSYYDKKELLFYGAEKGKKRLFTGEQLFWLYILNDTAKLGYTIIDNLQAIKHKFEHTAVVDGNYDKYNCLQYFLGAIIHERVAWHLRIDETGSYSFYNYRDLITVFNAGRMLESSHINIALGPVAEKIWKKISGQDLIYKKLYIPARAYTNKTLIDRIEKDDYERIEIIRQADGTKKITVIEKDESSFNQDLAKVLAQPIKSVPTKNKKV